MAKRVLTLAKTFRLVLTMSSHDKEQDQNGFNMSLPDSKRIRMDMSTISETWVEPESDGAETGESDVEESGQETLDIEYWDSLYEDNAEEGTNNLIDVDRYSSVS